ncbi:glycerate kinase [Cellulomonas sp. NPDC089187]|uniref:glycerate kinase n=1 Tax=Cellulomonas sp. NPDC089187 TaxID=3154970 RepID=UPI003414F74C
MHVLVSPGRFDRPTAPGDWSALSADEAARAIADGWRDARADDALDLLPMNDGGPGLIDTLHAACGGELIAVTVADAAGSPVPSAVLVLTAESGARTACVDGSVVLGGEVAAAESSTAGLGALIRAALDTGAQRVVIGTGPRRVSAHDGGRGLVRALSTCAPEDPAAAIPEVAQELRTRDVVLLACHDLPLLGLNGASAGLVDAGRATAEESQVIERRMADWVAAATAAAGPGRVNLLADTHGHDHGAATARGTGAITRPGVAPGSGAGGGAGFVLGLLGARRVDGATWVADQIGLADRVAQADLVVTGAGVLDGTALEEGVLPAVSAAALPLGIPVIAVAAQVRTGRRDWGAAGVAGAFGVIESPEQLGDWRSGPAAALRARLPRIARTWSR